MLALFLSLFSAPIDLPAAEVTLDPIGFDAVWVPPGTTGPIVAMPGPTGSVVFL